MSKERLVELIMEATESTWTRESLADHLHNNGVIVPHCNERDKVFLLLEKLKGGYDIVETVCVGVCVRPKRIVYIMRYDCPEIGNTLEYTDEDFCREVFLTREEAEAKLKE